MSRDWHGRGNESREPARPRSLRAPAVSEPAPALKPEPWKRHEVRDLHSPAGSRHRGRREDRGDGIRRSREQRVQDLLELVGMYRVVSRRAVVEHIFDGHTFAAARTLPALVRDHLLEIHDLPAGGSRYQVLTLTDTGRARAAVASRARRRKSGEAEEELQRYWSHVPDVRQLRHDQHVFEAVMQDTEDVRSRGGRIRRVRLESELRGLLASAGETARMTDGARGAERARRQEAARLGLRVFAKGVPLPDALVEIEEADGSRCVRAIEVVTTSYSSAQVLQKHMAGFRLYYMRAERRRQRRSLASEELYPLAWGR